MGAFNGRYDEFIDQFEQLDPRVKRQLQEWIQQYLDEESVGSPNVYAGNEMSAYGGRPPNQPDGGEDLSYTPPSSTPTSTVVPPPPRNTPNGAIGAGVQYGNPGSAPAVQNIEFDPNSPDYGYIQQDRIERMGNQFKGYGDTVSTYVDRYESGPYAPGGRNKPNGGLPPIADQGSGSDMGTGMSTSSAGGGGGSGNIADHMAQYEEPVDEEQQQRANPTGETDKPTPEELAEEAALTKWNTQNWRERAGDWRSQGSAYPIPGIADPTNDFGSDRWMDIYATNDDVTYNGGSDWGGKGGTVAMPDSWKEEMKGWAGDLRALAEEYYNAGQEEQFQRTRNVARSQYTQPTPGQNSGGQPNNGVVVPGNVTSTSQAELDAYNSQSQFQLQLQAGYRNADGTLTDRGRMMGTPDITDGSGPETKDDEDNRPPPPSGGSENSGPQVGVPTDVNDGVSASRYNGYDTDSIVIPPVPGSINQGQGQGGPAGNQSDFTDMLRDAFKNKKKVPWNDRNNPLGNLRTITY